MKGADGPRWTDEIFGPKKPDNRTKKFQPRGSRLRTSESVLTGENSEGAPAQLRVARIRIDRFTGGVVDGALFDEEPVYASRTHTQLELRNPKPGEIGLLLLVVRDLLTRDLPLGGSVGVGRGVACGTARICYRDPGATNGAMQWTIDPKGTADAATIDALNGFVSDFLEQTLPATLPAEAS